MTYQEFHMAGVLYILFTMFCHLSFLYIRTRQKKKTTTTIAWQLIIQTGFKYYFVIANFLLCLLIVYGDAHEEKVLLRIK